MPDKSTSLNALVKNRNLLIVAVIAMVAFLVLMIANALSFRPAGTVDPSKQITLTMWGIWDELNLMRSYIGDFQSKNPNIKIEYRKLSPPDYERELIAALAAGRGPDIFAMHHTWLGKHKSLMQPMPEGIMTLGEFRDQFVDVVNYDFVRDEKIWGFPLYTDTLALFYNKDAFNDVGIAQPPTTWEEFQDAVQRMTRIDQFGNFELSGAAIGSGENVNRASDIVSLLMLQSGAEMTDPFDPSTITLNKTIAVNGQRTRPAEVALRFYTDFSNPRTNVYTWNVAQNYNIDAFYERKTAMMLGYSYQVDQIKSKAPRLNWGIAKLPQISQTSAQVNYANYWGYTVSIQSQRADAAYRFLAFLAERENAQDYFLQTKRPTARRDLIDTQTDDLEYGVFVEQVLQAKSWQQPNNDAMDAVIIEAVEDIHRGTLSIKQAVEKIQTEAQLLADESKRNNL